MKKADFDNPIDPKPAAVTFQLDDGIGMNYPDLLDKKTIVIGNTSYTFRKDADKSQYTNPRIVSIKNANTVKEALERLTYFSDIDEVDVDETTNTVTLKASLDTYYSRVEANGVTSTYTVPNGTGEKKNGWKVENPEGKKTLGEVDGNGIDNNKPEYGTDLSLSLDLSGIKEPIDVANLRRNKLNVRIDGLSPSSISISYSQIISQTPSTITKKDFINAVINELKKTPPLNNSNTNIKYSDPKLEISTKVPDDSSSLPYQAAYIYESTEGKKEDPNGKKWTTKKIDFKTSTTPPSAEVGGTYTVEIPAAGSLNLPFSFKLGSYYHIFYDSTNPGTPITTDGTTMYSTGDYYTRTHDMKGKTPQQIRDEVVKMIKNYGGSPVKEQGNKLIFSANPNTAAPTFTIDGETIDVKTAIPASTSVLPGNTNYFSQEVSVPLNIEMPFDADKLIGKGFGMSNGAGSSIYRWEFTDGTGLRSDYSDIDISGCKDLTDLAAAMEAAIQKTGAFGKDYEVKVNDKVDPAVLSIQWRRSCSGSYQVSVSDGAEGVSGIMKDGPATFSGGTAVGHEQKILDFSSINTNNLDTLLGKGFRVNCATCEGEYVNVYFCWSNDGSAPPSFTHDVIINGQTVTRTIHNIPVELSKVTSGDQIVKSIVDQVRPRLNHYTDMEVGSPSTSLVIRDKRPGIVIDSQTKDKFYGSVDSGVSTNFIYSVTKKEIAPAEPPEGQLLNFRHSEIMIYAGHSPKPDLIPIHLPFLSLTQLRLNPPEQVDLTDKDQSPLGLLKKVDCAHDSIADCRAVMGADYNRLEHAYQALSSTAINIKNAESRIRDADMAALIMKKIKHDILSQSQQSIIAQAGKRPETVLQMLH